MVPDRVRNQLSSNRAMPKSRRPLCLLGLFEPYGREVSAAESSTSNGAEEEFRGKYSLFDAEAVCEKGGSLEQVAIGATFWDHDEELYIHNNTVVWSAGHHVRKRFSCAATVVQAKWCRMSDTREPLLCVLHSDFINTYTPSGEMHIVPLHCRVAAIWPLPCGLLLQRGADRTPTLSSDTFSMAMESPIHHRDWLREGFRDNVISPMPAGGSSARRSSFLSTPPASRPTSTFFYLQHPLEMPHPVKVEEGAKSKLLSDMDESVIWSSTVVPYVVTYHTGKRQHTVWKVKAAPADSESNILKDAPAWDIMESITLQRAWTKKGGQQQAREVFVATDEDGVPLLCLVIAESQQLFSFRLHSSDISSDGQGEPKLDVAWTITAISAAPIVATRPGLKNRGSPAYDILTLSRDGTVSLHTGRYHVCRYYLPVSAVQSLNIGSPGKGSTSVVKPMDATSGRRDEAEKVVGLCDPVQGRINVVTESGKMYRCAVGLTLSSAITVLCVNALSQGLRPALYRYLLSRLLEREFPIADALRVTTAKASGKPDLEWAAFSGLITEIIRDMPGEVLSPKKATPHKPVKDDSSAWNFLLQSSMHRSNLANLRYPGLMPKESFSIVETLPIPGPVITDNVDAETAVYFSVMVEILEVLHAVYEDCKLDTLRWRELWQLGATLSSLGAACGEMEYVDHYSRDFPLAVPPLPNLPDSVSLKIDGKVPPNLFQWLENCLRGKRLAENMENLPGLLIKESASCVDWSRRVIGFYDLLTGGEVVNGRLPSGVQLHIAPGIATSAEQRTVLSMVAEGFGLPELDRLPPGVSLPLRHALDRCREAPPGNWPAQAYVLIGREDLASTHVARPLKRMTTHKIGEKLKVDDASSVTKQFDDLWMAAPYTLHLRPISSLPGSSDPNDPGDPDGTAAGVDPQVVDGMEHMAATSASLRFGRDLRLNEVRRLLGSSKPVAVRTSNAPDVSDPDIVAQQQAQLWQLAQRTTALPFGRGAFTLGTSSAMLTEALPIPKLVLAGRLPSQHDATVNLDANTGNLADVTSWPDFHNGVAAGLRLAPGQTKISRTWIVYNKPDEPNFSHAGLLMALGLHKHLGVLAATDVYRYLSQEHEATTVGVLLGMSAAHRGTMDPGISKMLYLHIPARHPPSYPELELPTLVQSAALLAVGLLYQGSAHRLTTEILLAEIGRKPGGDNALDREGYALAAGLALGLVTLGRGRDAWGLADLHIEDRLRHYMSGGSDTIDERQRRFDGTVSSINSVSRGIDDQSQVMEGSTVNLDVTAPGATLALGLMFLKTNCEVVAARLAVPDTHFALEYVRPDFILLRLVARSLILWDSVQPTEEWIQAQIPGIVKEAMLVSSKEDGSPELPLNSDADLEALAQAHVNILAGACLSIGLRYAGTASVEAQQSLRHYALYFMNEKRAAVPHGAAASPNNRRQYVDRSTLETCLNIAVLSLSLVMAGTGHLETFRLLRFLRRRTDADGITFGNQMAISMAIGFLFLGGGGLTFATNNGAVAALLIALYPRFPTAPNDHRCHLQAFRHLYVLATEKRCLQTVDVDTGLPVYVPIEMTLKETAHYGETTFSRVTPCILPERNLLKRVRVCGPRYWPQDIELPAVDKPWWEPGESGPFDGGTLYVKRKVGARSYADDPIGCRSLLSRAIHKSGDGNCSQAAGRSQLSEVDQLVSTFSADPSILAFAQLFCSRADNRESSGEFDNFCLQALYESVSTDRPALLQTYMALYTSVGALIDRASGRGTSANSICSDSLSIYSLKIAVAYCDIIDQSAEGKPLVQRTFLTGLAKRVDDILNSPSLFSSEAQNPELKPFFSELFVYLDSRQFPLKQARQSDYGLKWTSALDTRARCILFSCFLCWYGIPQPRRITSALQQLVHEVPGFQNIIRSDLHSALPVLALALPSTPLPALLRISECLPALSLAQFR
jgi:anaphase-promoting complex subunit 1